MWINRNENRNCVEQGWRQMMCHFFIQEVKFTDFCMNEGSEWHGYVCILGYYFCASNFGGTACHSVFISKVESHFFYIIFKIVQELRIQGDGFIKEN